MKDQIETLANHFIGGGFFLEEAVELLERKLIERALERCKGNRSAASKTLGIHRNTLQRKMIEYELAAYPVRRKPVNRLRPVRRRVKSA